MGKERQTLEGLRTVSLRGRAIRGCARLVKVAMRSLGGEKMYRCADYVEDQDEDQVGHIGDLAVFSDEVAVPLKRKRGRPKGKTVAAGAKRPVLPKCDVDTVHWKPVRRFKRKGNREREFRCRCGTEGNHNYLADDVCERLVGPKPR